MFREALVGVVAGAVGTVALNVATYADMAIRARPSSSAPSKMVGILADKAGVALSSKGQGSQDEEAQNRESGLGALLGYVNGLGTGIAYGLIRSQLDDVSIPLASAVVGLTAMVASDTPLVALKVSDPRTWGAAGWASDVIPHLIYGLVTVAAFELLMKQD
ncbi:MAG: hypothetical protein ACR2H5_08490 [Ktedonobacteraceae bacterium]